MEGGSEHAADRCRSEGLPGIKCNILCRQVARTNMFFTPERISPTASTCKFQFTWTYYQVVECMVEMKWSHLSGDWK